MNVKLELSDRREPISDEVRISIKDLDLYYGDFQALYSINMNIYKNNVTALIGPSGCGKSTYIRTLNRMNDVIIGTKVVGNIYYDGVDIYSDYDVIELRKKIGMFFRNPIHFQ